jgi:hypothetical protein
VVIPFERTTVHNPHEYNTPGDFDGMTALKKRPEAIRLVTIPPERAHEKSEVVIRGQSSRLARLVGVRLLPGVRCSSGGGGLALRGSHDRFSVIHYPVGLIWPRP